MFSCPECIRSNLLNGNFISKKDMYHMLDEFFEIGIKGIIFIGGGEPLMYPNFGQVLEYSSAKGFKNGITTNGLLIDKYSTQIAENAEWTRVSIDASNKKSFQSVRPDRIINSFNRILTGMEKLAKIKKGLLGFSFLLLETRGFENATGLCEAAKLAKNLGCDYFEYKPMVDEKHFLTPYSDNFLKNIQEQEQKMKELIDNNFKILKPKSLIRYFQNTSLIQPKNYYHCPVMKVRTLVTSNGIYPCPYKRGYDEFNMGNIKNGFKNVYSNLNPSKHCNFYCIRDDINKNLLDILSGELHLENIEFNNIDDVFV